MSRPTWFRDRGPAALLLVAAACVAVFWATAAVSNYFLDPPYSYMVPGEWSNDLIRSRARFPSLPEAALHLVGVVVLVPAILCAVWAAARLWGDPFELMARRFVRKPTRLALVLSTLAAAAGASVAFLVIRQVFLIDDERAYTFQASLFGEGRLSLPEVPRAFRNPMFLLSPWMGKYPPGLSVLLIPGALVGVPHLIPPLLGGALVLSTYGFVREAYGERQALLAAALLAVSPFLWCGSGTVMAFTAAALAAMASLWLFARAQRNGAWSSFALSGLCFGLCLAVRPFDAVTLGVPLGIWLLADTLRPAARARFGIVPFALGVVPFVVGLLVYNTLTLGDPLRFGYVSAGDYSFGFYTQSLQGHPYFHTPTQGIALISVALMRLDTWLFGWPGAIFLFLPGFLLVKTRWDRFVVATVIVFVASHTLFASTGTWDVGPTYYFPVVPLLVVLAVRTLRAAREVSPAGSMVQRAVGWLPVAGACVAFVTILPVRLLRLSTVSTEIEKPWKAIAEAGVGDAIVLLPSAYEMAAPVYALGYPYRIDSGSGTAHLVRPHTVQELDEARRVLGRELPVYVLTLDQRAFRELGVRRYAVRPRS